MSHGPGAVATEPNPVSDRQSIIVATARACIGTPFRSQGRAPGRALDCVGVALVAAAAAAPVGAIPPYAIRGDHGAIVETTLAAIGCTPVDTAAPGDLLVIAPALRQRHLAIVTPLGIVHAHAGLGRVVEGPLDPGWVIIGAWRFPGAC